MKNISEETINKIVKETINKTLLKESKTVYIKRRNWQYLDYENGERVLECTPKSVLICSDNCSFRIVAYKRYEEPKDVNQLNNWSRTYWKYLGCELKVLKFEKGKWVINSNNYPKLLKNKKSVMEFIKKTKTFNLAKKELNFN